MIWAVVIGLALGAFVLGALAFRLPRPVWGVLGGTLVLGLAGYAVQGSPRQPGAPKSVATADSGNLGGSVVERQKLGAGAGMTDKHLVIADALARHGQFADAAEVLRGAVDKDPGNSEAWLAMANALVGHAEGTISPAATYAYGRAAKAAPDSAGPPLFMGLALIRSGQLEEGRAMWADLLARSPKDAPWREELELRLRELDAFLARQAGGQPRAETGAQ